MMGKVTGAISARGTYGRRALRQTAVAVFLGFAATSAPFLTSAQAQSYSFSAVSVEGNERVDAATIISYAGIARGEQVSAAALNDAYQRIVNSGLFETVDVRPQGGTLVITVKEYPIVNVIDFEGNKRLKDEQLSEIATSKSRRVYSPAAAEADAAAIAEAYRVSGRMAATVDPRLIRRSDNRVDLVFEITEGKVVEVERLSFVGNRAFSDRRLRQILETKQAGLLRQVIQKDTYVAERLDLDKQLLRDFYLSRGYVDFQVVDASAELSRERDGTFVTFNIREGQSFNVGKISTTSAVEGVDAAEFEAVQKLRPGVTYSPAIIENNIARMENLALRKGLNFLKIEPKITRNDRDQTLDVEFVLSRGERVFVERIDIQGNNTTLDQVVRRQFRTVEGDPFNPREIRQAAERIRALGFFVDAKVDAQPGTSGDQVVVDVNVEEQPTGKLSFGATYGAQSGLGLNIGFSETNFLGRGQSVSANISNGTDNRDISIGFAEPAFLGRDLKFKFGAYYRTTDQQDADYNTSNAGLTTGLEFPISENGRLELRYRISEDEITDLAAGSSDILARETALGGLLTSSIGYSYSYDTRTNGLNPNGGILLRFGQDFAGAGGDTKYILTSAFALAETKVLKEEVTVRAIFEGGMLNSIGDNTSRVTERFFANGKLRGFDRNGLGPRDLTAANRDALGGNIYATARFEADFPLGLPEEYGITGGAFFDVGSVWSLDDAAGTGGAVDDSFHLRSAIGLSVFWTTPIGPLRFNFSRALAKEDYDKEQTFDLTISTKF
jgi:outer membrane protein insertion porin family